jgi:hypothetical protein
MALELLVDVVEPFVHPSRTARLLADRRVEQMLGANRRVGCCTHEGVQRKAGQWSRFQHEKRRPQVILACVDQELRNVIGVPRVRGVRIAHP